MSFEEQQKEREKNFRKYYSTGKDLIAAGNFIEAIPALENAKRELNIYRDAWVDKQRSESLLKWFFGATSEFVERNLATVNFELGKCFVAIQNYEQAYNSFHAINIQFIQTQDLQYAKVQLVVCKDAIRSLAINKAIESQRLLTIIGEGNKDGLDFMKRNIYWGQIRKDVNERAAKLLILSDSSFYSQADIIEKLTACQNDYLVNQKFLDASDQYIFNQITEKLQTLKNPPVVKTDLFNKAKL